MTKQTLRTETSILRSGSDLGIFTFYKEFEKNIRMFISQTVQNIGGVSFKEGELVYENIGWGEIDFKINNKGELIAIGGDADKFNIDDEGYLTVTE
jgi:hypothetical protein